MFKALVYSPAVLPVIMIGGMMMSFEARAQPTVDENEAFCQSRTWEKAVNEMREDVKSSCQSTRAMLDETQTAKDVGKVKEDLEQVKSLLGSHQREDNKTERAVNLITEGLAEVKSLLRSHQQEETGTARDVRQMKEDLAEVKSLLGSLQVQRREFSSVDSSTLCE